MIRRLAVKVAVIALLGSAPLETVSAQDFRPAFPGSPTGVLNFAEEMFFLTGSSGSVVLSGTCWGTDNVVPDALPHPPPGPFHNIDEALTDISRLDAHLSWSRDADGMLRVGDDRVRDDVLRIRLRQVHFRDSAEPAYAVQDVLSAPEVRAYFTKNHIADGALPHVSRLGPGSTKGLPRLSGDLRDVTVAEALDHVVRFFPGLWVYAECGDGPRRRVAVEVYQVRFAGTASSGGPVGQP